MMKKALSAVLSLIMLFGLSVVSFAQDGHIHEYSCVQVNEDDHILVCECGDELTQAHSFSDWRDNNDSGLFTNGTQTAVCGVCGFEKTEKIPGSSTLFHPFFELYYVLKDFAQRIIDWLIAAF